MSKRKNKKSKKLLRFIFSLLLLLILALIGYFLKDYFIKDSSTSSQDKTSKFESSLAESSNLESSSSTLEYITQYDELQIHFLELGNYATGDSTYIKAGDIDILIDAGSTQSSALTIINYINQYCKDGKLEYVITTHAHDDHYSGMFGLKQNSKNAHQENIQRNGILYYYDVGTLIDFSLTNKNIEKPTGNYLNYIEAVNYAVSKGTIHYSAKDCYTQNKTSFILDEALNISLDILYNKFYFEKSDDENNYSVCSMINYNDLHFMFTGDLEKKGEEELAAYYNGETKEKTLPHVCLFKAGHHGSKTSSNDILLQKITPEICCVCCCGGSDEYTTDYLNTFPTQDFINRISKYTDAVYVTTCIDEKSSREKNEQVYQSLNGNICVSSDGVHIGVKGSNNTIKLKDSEWFNQEIYVVANEKGIYQISSGNKKTDYYIESDLNVQKVVRRVWPK